MFQLALFPLFFLFYLFGNQIKPYFLFFSVNPWYPGERGTCNKNSKQKHILDWLSVTQRIRKKTNHHIISRNVKNELVTLPEHYGLVSRESARCVYKVDHDDIGSAMNCYPDDIVNNNSFSDCLE